MDEQRGMAWPLGAWADYPSSEGYSWINIYWLFSFVHNLCMTLWIIDFRLRWRVRGRGRGRPRIQAGRSSQRRTLKDWLAVARNFPSGDQSRASPWA